jgi:PAS domain S-box-containing protein
MSHVSSHENHTREPEGPSTAEVRAFGVLSGLRDHATCLLGPQGHIETWSPSAEQITGFSAEEVTGKHVSVLYPPEQLAAGEPTHELARAETEGQFEADLRRARKDGSRFLAHFALTALRGQAGRVRGFVLVLRDLTEQRRADEVLRMSEERFRAFVESIEDYAIFMVDPEGRVTSWNSGAARIEGYFIEEILGQPIERFYSPEDQAAGKPRRLLREAAERGRVEDEGWRVRKDGTRFWADVVLTAVRGPRGELRGFAKVTRDLTERRRAEEELRRSEERFRLLVEGVEDYAIFMLDPTGLVVTWNEGAQRILGYRGAEIIGQPVTRLYLEDDAPETKRDRELEVAGREGRFEEEGWRVRKDGSRFRANVILTGLRDAGGKLIGYTKVLRDLTQLHQLEGERMRLVQAEEAIRLRDEFLSIASHELKTPLTALQLQVQGLQHKMRGLNPDLATRLARATRAGQRLADLIETLLDVSRIATGRFELRRECFDLAETVDEVIDRLRESAARAGCEVRAQTTPGLVGQWDRLRIEQVLTNLLSNAFKYGHGHPVEVALNRTGAEVALLVADHGPGIAEADLVRIFGRFERAVSMRHFGGLGLGLYVAQQIVEAHGGTVEAQNAPEGGARFTVRLRLLACPPRE